MKKFYKQNICTVSGGSVGIASFKFVWLCQIVDLSSIYFFINKQRKHMNKNFHCWHDMYSCVNSNSDNNEKNKKCI